MYYQTANKGLQKIGVKNVVAVDAYDRDPEKVISCARAHGATSKDDKGQEVFWLCIPGGVASFTENDLRQIRWASR